MISHDTYSLTRWGTSMMDGVHVRPAERSDIKGLLALYTELAEGREVSVPISAAESGPVLDAIMANPERRLLVAAADSVIAGSIDLIIIPNLTHHGRPWAIVENVIVDQNYRRAGIGTALMERGLAEARDAGCYKVQLHSGKQRLGPHAFYRSLGFDAVAEGFKIYFDRTAG